jgi:hypothetical protein
VECDEVLVNGSDVRISWLIDMLWSCRDGSFSSIAWLRDLVAILVGQVKCLVKVRYMWDKGFS